jgi:RNA polymerase sigma-70 factor (ECF subfamily)
MTNPPLLGILQHLCTLAGTEADSRQADRDLLQRFAAARDEAAFATLLRRHGPLVWGLCRQVLRDVHAAEDVFQATFLVLARKAGSIRRQEALPAWLYRVAFNLAATAKVGAARRRSQERRAVPMAAANPLDEVVLRDWQPILHEEVNRLPEKYRIPVVLCYLRGKSHAEAGRELGWPVGTVKACLARARDLLRTRLARRGLTLSAGGLATLLASASETAAIPATLLQATLQAALWFVAGQATVAGAASAQALLLAKGALKTMTVSKPTLVIGFLLLAGVVGSGVFALRTYGDGGSGGPPADGAGLEPPALAAGVPVRPERRDPDRREVAMPIDQAVVHRIDKEIMDTRPVPEGAVVVGNPPFFVKPPGEQVKALVQVFKEARTRGQKGKVEVKAGLNLNVLATGPLLHNPDEAVVRRLVRRGGQLDLEVVHTRTTRIDRNVACRLLVQVPLDLPPGSYKLVVTWREVESITAGKPAAVPPLVETFDFEVVERLAASKAVRSGAVEFQTVVDARCPVPAAGGSSPIDIGLRLTNRGGKELVFDLFDTITMNLKSADGKLLERDGGRNVTLPCPPLGLGAGRSATVFRSGRIEWQKDGKALVLTGPDGAGGVWLFRGLGPGKYLLSIQYENTEARERIAPEVIRGRTVWKGQAQTEPVEFAIVPPKAAQPGRAAAVEKDGVAFELLLPDQTWSIPEDKPGLKTPTKLGLRLTNKTDKPLRFARFATPLPEIAGLDGKPLKPTAGVWKRTPLITEADFPLVLPGESVTFSIDAALFWRDGNLQWGGSYANAGDATAWGSSWSFHDLKPGRYKVRVVYQSKQASATVDPDHKVLTDIWTGRIEAPFVEVSLRERAKDGKP